MDAEIDHELTANQWETLKALRLPAAKGRVLNRFIVDQLVALQLAAKTDGHPVLTAQGRKALVRGSARLLDLAA